MLRALFRPYLALPREVYILCVGTFVNRAGSFVMPFIAIYLSSARGFDDTFVTLTIGVYGAGSTLASLAGGALADRIGRKPVMVSALIAGALSLMLLSTLTTKATILGGTLLFAMTMDLYRPAASATISELVTPEQRPRAFALLYVAVNLGFACGAMIGGMVAKLSFEWLFYADAATSALYALIIVAAIPETLGKTPPQLDSKGQVPSASNAEAIMHMLRNRAFVIFCIATFLSALVFHQSESTLALYVSKLGIPPDRYGQMVAVNGVLIVVLQLPAAQWLSRWSRSAIIAGGMLLTGVGFGLTGVFTTVLPLVFTVVLWTLGEIMMAVFHSPVISDLSPERFRARYFGVFAGMFGSSMMFGPPLGGFVLDRFGATALWGGCFVLSAIAASLLLPVRRELDGAKPGPLHGERA